MAVEFGALQVRLTANMEDLAKGLKAAAGELKSWSDKNKDAMHSIGMAATAAGAAITTALGFAVKSAADFEQAITRVGSVTGKTGKDLAGATQQIAALAKDIGTNTVYSAKQAADALFELQTKGFDAAAMSARDMIPFINLAAGTQSDLASTTMNVLTILRTFGMQEDEVSKITDIMAKTFQASGVSVASLGGALSTLAPVARAAGVNLEEISAVIGVVDDLGIDAGMAVMAMKRSFSELMAPSEGTQKTLAQLGLTMGDVDLRTKGFVGVLQTLKEAGITGAQVMDIFTVRAGPLINTLLQADAAGRATYESVTALTQGLKDSAGTAQSLADQQMATLNAQMTVLKNSIISVGINIGQALLPGLVKIAQFLATATGAIADFISKHQVLAGTITVLTAALGGYLTVLGTIKLTIEPLSKLLFTLAGGMDAVGTSAKVAQAATTGMTAASAGAQASLSSVGMAAQVAAGNIAKQAAATEAAKLATIGYATILTTVFIVAIATTVAAIKGIIDVIDDLREAKKIAADADKREQSETIMRAEQSIAVFQNMREKYVSLTDAETERLISVRAMTDELQVLVDQQASGVQLTDEEIKKMNELNLAIRGTVAEIDKAAMSRGELTNKQMAQQQLDVQEMNNKLAMQERIRELTQEYVNLQTQMASSGMTAQEYATAYENIRQQFTEIYGTADQAQQKMKELDESDPTITATFELIGMGDLDAVEQRIKALDNEERIRRAQWVSDDEARREEIKIDAESRMQHIEDLKKANENARTTELAGVETTIRNESMLRQSAVNAKTEQEFMHLEQIDTQVRRYHQSDLDKINEKYDSQSRLLDEALQKEKMSSQEKVSLVDQQEAKERERHEMQMGYLNSETDAYREMADVAGRVGTGGGGGGSSRSGGGGGGGGGSRSSTKVSSGAAADGGGYVSSGGGGYAAQAAANPALRAPENYYLQAARTVASTVSSVTNSLISMERGVSSTAKVITGSTGLQTYVSRGIYGQAGKRFVPHTGWYGLHKGEAVINAEEARVGRNAVPGSAPVIINVFDEKLVPQIMAKYPNAIVNPVLNSALTSPITRQVLRAAVR